MNYDIYTGLLKVFSLPTAKKMDIHFEYVNNNPEWCRMKNGRTDWL